MKIATRLLLAACLTLPFAACKKEEAPVAEAAPLTAPSTDDDVAWKTYLQEVVINNMGTITNTPYMYYLPAESDPEFEAKYGRQLEQSKTAMARGITAGNLIAFASPASAKAADLAVASFEGVEPDTLKGVRVLFIGDTADNARVQVAVQPSGAEYVFVEAK
ncbi:hypothetical protein [Pseudoxanthomonas wuyuanensis]